MSPPTAFPDLNAVLDEFVASVRDVLADNFCGAYLQGSFAIGDADEHSDVDFIIVTEREVSEAELERLQAMHQRLDGLDVPWAQHLEGSYFPKGHLAQIDDDRTPLLFLDNGTSELELDPRCNTAVVRWVLRERGVVLDGPDPRSLIEPVTSSALRDEGREALREFTDWAPAPTKEGGMSQWKQTYLVNSFCRILAMMDSGKVCSKRQGAEWALVGLDPEWHDLILRALADRPIPGAGPSFLPTHKPHNGHSSSPPTQCSRPIGSRASFGLLASRLRASDASMFVKRPVALRSRGAGRGCGRGSA